MLIIMKGTEDTGEQTKASVPGGKLGLVLHGNIVSGGGTATRKMIIRDRRRTHSQNLLSAPEGCGL